ncbi:MAG: hypothetical protein HC921_02790 [Synechococcaceae cyanobacterium SM2_3_1]|nr:hypothetical protein [Synechococcaceae cyanobacterium SM2_3_1]
MFMYRCLSCSLALLLASGFWTQAAHSQPQLDPGSSRLLESSELEEVQALIPTATILETQSFRVKLQGQGMGSFVAAQSPPPDPAQLQLYWIQADEITSLPQPEDTQSWTLFSLDAVVFTELDFDGLADVYIISRHLTGIGPTGADPFPWVTFYLQQPDGGFEVDPDLSRQVSERGVGTVSEVETILRAELRYLP